MWKVLPVVCCRGSAWLEVDQNGDDKHSKDADYVMRYGNERWEVPVCVCVCCVCVYVCVRVCMCVSV